MRTPNKTSKSLLGRRIYEVRVKNGLSQEKLGVAIGLDEQTASARISRYESGVHEPAIVIASNIARALNVPLAYLYCERDDMAALLIKLARASRSDIQKILSKL